MIDSSFEWAASRGLTRINPVHKEEEAKLIISEKFGCETEKGERMQLEGQGTCEDRGCFTHMLFFKLRNLEEYIHHQYLEPPYAFVGS